MMPCEIKNILSLDGKLYDCAILPQKSNHNSKKEKTYGWCFECCTGFKIDLIYG